MTLFLHFGMGNEPRQTIEVESRESPLWWQEKGLMYNASGYGARIPTRHMVKYNNKWRRVYCAIYGNSGTCYIGKPGAWIAVVDN